jgi:hypothetical protein
MMTEQTAAETTPEADLEADVDTVVAACGGSMRAAIRALLIANEFLSGELERARARQSLGYVRSSN